MVTLDTIDVGPPGHDGLVYREAPPPPHLREAVRCVWRSGIGPAKPIVPDGCLDLMVAGEQVIVAGADTTPWWTTLPSATEIRGVRFRPGHAPRVLGVAADELTDQRVAVSELWGSSAADRLRERPDTLLDVVASRLTAHSDPELDALLARLTRGVARVSDAVTGLTGSERALRRRFTAAVGYGPATYLRIARLQRALALRHTTGELATLAAEAGYADQAHLSRDCRSLTGATPSELFRR